MRQHLASVSAAAAVACAELQGAEIGSRELTFRPQGLVGGEYHFRIGTAGSTTLVLQTVLPLLLLAEKPSRIILEGGTHNPMAPTFDFLELVFGPSLARMGAPIGLRLERPGYYPAGGGRLVAEIQPARDPRPLSLPERGPRLGLRAFIDIANLPARISQDEAELIAHRLSLSPGAVEIRRRDDSPGPGNVVQVLVEHREVSELASAFGERGLPARTVAARCFDDIQSYLKGDAPVGVHLADQLLVPLALLAGGEFRTFAPSRHTRTNAEVIARFLGPSVEIDARDRRDCRIRVAPRG
jgi:RNA 3'-terminal phosphate cyclase (ATP)